MLRLIRLAKFLFFSQKMVSNKLFLSSQDFMKTISLLKQLVLFFSHNQINAVCTTGAIARKVGEEKVTIKTSPAA